MAQRPSDKGMSWSAVGGVAGEVLVAVCPHVARHLPPQLCHAETGRWSWRVPMSERQGEAIGVGAGALAARAGLAPHPTRGGAHAQATWMGRQRSHGYHCDQWMLLSPVE